MSRGLFRFTLLLSALSGIGLAVALAQLLEHGRPDQLPTADVAAASVQPETAAPAVSPAVSGWAANPGEQAAVAPAGAASTESATAVSELAVPATVANPHEAASGEAVETRELAVDDSPEPAAGSRASASGHADNAPRPVAPLRQPSQVVGDPSVADAPSAAETIETAPTPRPRLARPRAPQSAQAADTAADVAQTASDEPPVETLDPGESAEAVRQARGALPVVVEPSPPLAQQATGDVGVSLGQVMQLLEQVRGNSQPTPAPSGPSVSDVIKIVESLTGPSRAPEPPSAPGGQAPRRGAADELPAPEDVAADSGEDQDETAAGASGGGTTQIEAGENGLSIHIQNADLRSVLELLSEQGGLNILASKGVQGTVSASLNGVDVEEALDAILRTVGYVARRDGQFVYVGSPQDFDEVDRAIDRIGTRIYRPNYTPAAELNALLTPLITETVGKISVTSPAATGIGSGGSGSGASSASSGAGAGSTGGNSFASSEAVVVQDYERVLKQLDQVVAEVDQRPLQVAIEAMILSVRLNDSLQAGIDWELLRQQENIRLGMGQPRTAPIEGGGLRDANTGAKIGSFQYANGGLNFAFMDADLGSFVTFLETIGDTNVIATPRLLCLNKQMAQILIGAQLGYISTTITETSTAQNVQFLEVGAQLRLRPFISSDGLIRMEIHPELSTGTVRTAGGFTLPDKEVTQVTTNIMTRDGCTVIIGGLMREDLSTTSTQIPVLGNLPAVGFLFRQKTEMVERRELLVLVTPHIVYDEESAAEGEQGAMEFHRRQGVRADKMSPAGKRLLGRKYFRAAQAAWEAGDAKKAMHYIRWSVQFDPENRAAIDLRADIVQGRHDGKHSGGPWLVDPAVGEDDGPLPDWMFEELGAEVESPEPLHPLDPGTPGPVRHIEQPRVESHLD